MPRQHLTTDRHPRFGSRGFTMIEMVIAVAFVGLLASFAIPSYLQSVTDARVVKAIAEMQEIEREVKRYDRRFGTLPDSLNDIDMALEDPWGNPYYYLKYVYMGNGKPQGARMDKNLRPVNSTFDLYSAGEDGDTQAAFTAKASHDDIVRAGDGGYWGYAEDYTP